MDCIGVSGLCCVDNFIDVEVRLRRCLAADCHTCISHGDESRLCISITVHSDSIEPCSLNTVDDATGNFCPVCNKYFSHDVLTWQCQWYVVWQFPRVLRSFLPADIRPSSLPDRRYEQRRKLPRRECHEYKSSRHAGLAAQNARS